MLVGQALRLELLLEFLVVNALEGVLERAVVDLEDRVLRRQVDGIVTSERVGEAGAGKTLDRRIEVEHAHRDAAALGLPDFPRDRLATALRRPADRDGAGAREREILRAVLIAKTVSSDDHGLVPVRDEARHVLADDRLAEDRAV